MAQDGERQFIRRMMETRRSAGLSFGQWLTLVFVAAKLGGAVAWPWWVVLSPWLASLVIGVGAVFVLLVFGQRYGLFD